LVDVILGYMSVAGVREHSGRVVAPDDNLFYSRNRLSYLIG